MVGGKRLAAAILAATVAAGCGGSDGDRPEPTRDGSPPERGLVSGPLCEVLPSGDDPGAPESLTGEPANVVLTWIPVATTFEAAVRAVGMDDELDDVTVLVPTDDAFTAAIERQRLDDLLLTEHRELRTILEAHVIEGARSLAELRDGDSVTTLDGTPLTLDPAGEMVRFGGRAETICADYEASNARLHVIDGVLGPTPRP